MSETCWHIINSWKFNCLDILHTIIIKRIWNYLSEARWFLNMTLFEWINPWQTNWIHPTSQSFYPWTVVWLNYWWILILNQVRNYFVCSLKEAILTGLDVVIHVLLKNLEWLLIKWVHTILVSKHYFVDLFSILGTGVWWRGDGIFFLS